MNKLLIVLLPLLLLINGCATNPVTGDSDFALVSEDTEIEQGRSYHQSIINQYGIYDDPQLQAYVNKIGQELASKSHRAHLTFTFTVLDSPDINAFALPGGYIYITRGIMAYLNSEAELAGVLGHEIGHVTARHSVRQQSGQFASSLLSVLITAATGNEGLGNLGQQLGTGLVRGYGRDHELEADRLGAEYLHSNSYDPESMLEVIGVLKDQEVYEKALAKKENRDPSIYHGVFSTHPRNDDRLKTVVRAAKKLSSQTYKGDNQAIYHSKINGMVWGPSIKQGVVNANRFAHPDLAFALEFPQGWKINNNAEYLQARNPKNSALVQIGVIPRKQNESLQAMLKRLSKNDELEVSQQPWGAVAEVRVKPQNGDFQPAVISAIELDNQQVLTIMGTASSNEFKQSNPAFSSISESFSRLNAAQVRAIKVPRLRILTNHDEASFTQLAKKSPIQYEAESKLRLLNRAFPDGNIASIKPLKTITVDE